MQEAEETFFFGLIVMLGDLLGIVICFDDKRGCVSFHQLTTNKRFKCKYSVNLKAIQTFQ